MNLVRTLRTTLFCLFALCALGGSARAQEVRATITGRVMDPQGALVPNATVVVVNDDNNVRQETKTNNQGVWVAEFLLPGHYGFTISAAGFKTEDHKGITLSAGDVKQIDTALQVGASSQTVDVTADAALIDTTAATSGTVISHEEIAEMPSSSHVVTLLATFSPGVVAQDQNNNIAHLWSYNAASQFTSDGGRNNVWSNTFQLDGSPDMKAGGDVAFIPPMDSVQEFRVSTNAYDASIGRQAGATVNMQTRSGGKSYHGVLYEFNQNSAMNANLFQTNLIGGAVAPVHFNEWGGTFGGPVYLPKLYHGKDKTFFFVSYDDTHNMNPLGSGSISVPTALERTGDFSQSFTTQTVGGQLTRYPIQVYDPLTVNTATGNRTLFPNNQIPTNRLSAIAQNILKFVPLPNTPSDGTSNTSNDYAPPSVRLDTFPLVSIRLDQNWSNSQRTFATLRWHHLIEHTGDTFGLDNIAAGSFTERVNKGIGLDHVWTMSPTRVLNLRYSLTRYEEPGYDAGAGFNETSLGIPASFVGQLPRAGFPYITGVAGNFGTTQTQSFHATTYHTLGATFTQVHGNHTFRYGGEFWVLQDSNFGNGNAGEFDFNSNFTRQNNANAGGTGVGSTFATFLLDMPSGGSVPRNASAFYSQHYTAGFFQDDWRVTSRLTVNLGMHWDYERPVEERFNRIEDRYDPNTPNPISGSAQAAYASILANPANASNAGVQLLQQLLPSSQFQVNGIVQFAGVNGVPRTTYNTDLHEWQPRVGFAYNLGHNTVVRGGFGRFTQADYNTGAQFGYSRSTSLTATTDNYLTSFDTMAHPFQNGILAPTGSSLGALTNLGSSWTWDNPDLNRFYSWEYSLHVQHEWNGWLFELGYSHNKTYDISWGWNENEPSFANWQKYNTPTFVAGRPVDTLNWNLQVPNPFYHLAGVSASNSIYTNTTIALNQLLNPNPLFGGITENNPTGQNRFDAGLGKIERRFKKGFSIIASFTWSKLFEDTAFYGGSQLASQGKVEHKLGGEDRPFHLNIAPIWDIPVGRKQHFGTGMPVWADAILGGWEMSGNYNIQSGVPVVFSTPAFFSGQNFSLPGGKQSLNQWFDTTQFYPFPSKSTSLATLQSYPAWTGIQNLPGYSYVPAASDSIKNGVYQDFAANIQTFPTRWNDVRASRVNEANAGLYKNFRFTEAKRLQLRFDVFNLFNHPRFGAPDTNPGDATFGRVTGSQQNQARTVELGAKLTF